jgi:uncharacterized protein YsxB (DUF464 family)
VDGVHWHQRHSNETWRTSRNPRWEKFHRVYTGEGSEGEARGAIKVVRPEILGPPSSTAEERHLAERKRSVRGEPSAEVQMIQAYPDNMNCELSDVGRGGGSYHRTARNGAPQVSILATDMQNLRTTNSETVSISHTGHARDKDVVRAAVSLSVRRSMSTTNLTRRGRSSGPSAQLSEFCMLAVSNYVMSVPVTTTLLFIGLRMKETASWYGG